MSSRKPWYPSIKLHILDGPVTFSGLVYIQQLFDADEPIRNDCIDSTSLDMTGSHTSTLLKTERGNTWYTFHWFAGRMCVAIPKAKPVLTVGQSERTVQAFALNNISDADVKRIGNSFALRFHSLFSLKHARALAERDAMRSAA